MVVRLIVRRLFFLVFVLFGLSLITFSLSRLVAGDPARMIAGPRSGKAQLRAVRERYGLNVPVPVQYINYGSDAVRFDFGDSAATRRPVSEDLKRYLPATVELGLAAFILATVIGVPLGVLSAAHRN